MSTRDSNSNVSLAGGAVQVVKGLKVKVTSTTLKRGTTFKNVCVAGAG